EELIEDIGDDELVQRGLEADLGLPVGALDKGKLNRPPTTGIDEYINAVDPDPEKLAAAFEAIKTYMKFWTTVFEAAQTEDPSVVASEALYRLFQFAAVEHMKFEHPSFYATMRLIGAVQQNLLVTVEESFAPEVGANMFTAEHWKQVVPSFLHGYQNFRLDQAPDFVLAGP